MAIGFTGKVARSYVLQRRRVLVLEDGYAGDVEAGDWVEVALPEGDAARAQIATVAWGSAFHAEDPPLTLVVTGLDEQAPAAGAAIRGVAGPD
jgi:hypothetical protein